jgi:hypothetical protein
MFRRRLVRRLRGRGNQADGYKQTDFHARSKNWLGPFARAHGGTPAPPGQCNSVA